jgi:hypothetical protein
MKLTKIATAIAAALTLSAMPAGAAPPSGLDGVYRTSWTESQLIAAGTSQEYAHGNKGVLTWTLQHGTFTLDFGTPPLCHGTYAVSGHTVSVKQGPGCNGVWTAQWSLTSGSLRLHVTKATNPGDRVLFGGKPWTKMATNAIDGVYRVTISDADLSANGVAARDLRANHGTFIWTLHDGRWRFSQHADDKVFTVPWAPYTLSGDRVTFVFRVPGAPQGAPPPLTFRWKLAAGELSFTHVGGTDPSRIVPTFFTSHPWQKIA